MLSSNKPLSMQMSEEIISLKSISKLFANGVLAVNGISFNCYKKDILGLVGRNGAGKTTAIRIMTGSIYASSGTASLFGSCFTPDSVESKRKIGYVSAEDILFDYLTGEEQVLLTALAYGVELRDAKSRIEDLFKLVDFNIYDARKRIRHYSYGMKKKIAVCCAFVHNPSLIFLDEPLEGLDVITAGDLKSAFRHMSSKGKTVVITSHNLNLINDLCTRVLIMEGGRLIYDGSTVELVRETSAARSLEEAFIQLVGGPSSKTTLPWMTEE